jgi:hypothetical protein
MTTILPVKYVSQIMTGALEHKLLMGMPREPKVPR